MTEVILDPEDPSVAFIGSASEAHLGAQVGDATLVNIHDEQRCAGRPCVIHHPSDHHMRGWTLNWRADRGLMERLCPHGIGHPDPDAMWFQRSIGRDSMAIHGCDGCCATPTEANPASR